MDGRRELCFVNEYGNFFSVCGRFGESLVGVAIKAKLVRQFRSGRSEGTGYKDKA